VHSLTGSGPPQGVHRPRVEGHSRVRSESFTSARQMSSQLADVVLSVLSRARPADLSPLGDGRLARSDREG
jgi:hypothetical protein